jgi:hypothetical protein
MLRPGFGFCLHMSRFWAPCRGQNRMRTAR